MNRPIVLALGLFAVASLCACPPQGVVCNAGLSQCGTGCADLSSDKFNCGACGGTCGLTQICVQGTCQCQPGSIFCNGTCIVPTNDPHNCGGCALADGGGGTACASDQVCEQGVCKASCTLGTSTVCGQSCVNTQTDTNNCGGCGIACQNGATCHAGNCAYDLVAACYNDGEVVGVQAGSDVVGPPAPLGSFPAYLAQMGLALLDADGINNALYEARVSDLNALPETPALGSGPNALVVDDPFVYVLNSLDNTLQVLQRNGVPFDAGVPDAGAADAGLADAGSDAGLTDAGVPGDGGLVDGGLFPPPQPLDIGLDAGLGLVTVAEINFGANTDPFSMVKVGSSLYVTLYLAQKIQVVDITNPLSPRLGQSYDLTTLPSFAFDGGAPIPGPEGTVARGSVVYATLTHLDSTYQPAGNGALARLDTDAGTLSAIDLGASCLDPQWAATDGTNLFVSCTGQATYNASFFATGTVASGVVMLNGSDLPIASWTPTCPTQDAGTDAGCATALPGALAVAGGHLYVADVNAGRVFDLAIDGGQLVEQRGFQVCPIERTTGISDVSHLVAIP